MRTPVTHHPNRNRLMEYAAGSISPERAFVLATHVGACAACATEVAAGERAAGDMLNDLPAAPLRADALAHALARTERSPARGRDDGHDERPGPADWITVPRAVAEAGRQRRRWAAPGVWVAPVTGRAHGARGYLLRVAPGMSVPRHTHLGVEMVCILKGAFLDRGAVFEAGDYCESDEVVVHNPVARLGEECVCLVAVDQSLVPLDWIGKLFQPLVRI